ncbi:unnamed protein product [Bemisia tabaci]|uniref:Very-long-chain 3-oxoacyl-CoA synthase n=1 Tax=Bemisia tabaci TaxID=7038 RepID=A0A9P0AEF8_BEMTA|nr:unnamed protein product [Bemisia tabaci]
MKRNYVGLTLTNYSYMFNFEEEFEHQNTRVWMTNNWTKGFYYCGLYMVIIFLGQLYMKSRPRFELRKALICHFISLPAGSQNFTILLVLLFFNGKLPKPTYRMVDT